MLPQYEIECLLGRGGMGAVYKGRQTQLDRLVAIKILPPDLDGGGHDFTSRFKLEARSMARLKHANIITVYDFGQTAEGLLYFVMEFVEGMDVQAMIAQEGRLRSADAIAIAAHVCEALHYAHSNGIIHRDIKPANVIVGNDGHVRVADFGLVKVMNAAQTSHLTMSGSVMGTPNYLAPESLTLGMSVDHRVDIYAVGVMLYHMLTGKVPRGMFELPSQKVPGLDPRLDAIIAHAMQEDRELRYQSAEELRSDLVSILTQPVPQTVVVATKAEQKVPSSASSHSIARHTAITAHAEPEQAEEQEYDEIDPAVEAMLRTTNSMNNTMLILGLLAIGLIGGLAIFLANRKTGDVHNFQQTITTTTTNNTYFTQLIAAGITSKEDLAALEEIRPLGEGFVGISRTSQTWTQAMELAHRTGAEILTVDTTQTSDVESLSTWLSSKAPAPAALWVKHGDQPALLAGKALQPPDSQDTPHPTLLIWQPEKIATTAEPSAFNSAPTAASTPAPVPPPAATSPTAPPPPKIHPWTDVTGKTIQAEFLRLEDEVVVIRMNHTEFKVPFTRLSPPSIEQARQLAAQPK
jgi:serine/threonine protein kinase